MTFRKLQQNRQIWNTPFIFAFDIYLYYFLKVTSHYTCDPIRTSIKPPQLLQLRINSNTKEYDLCTCTWYFCFYLLLVSFSNPSVFLNTHS